MKQRFQLAALSLAGADDAGVAIAASRADALGVLDLTLTPDSGTALRLAADLARLGRGRLGVRLDARRADLLERIAASLPTAIRNVFLSPCEPDLLREGIALLRPLAKTILVEATSLEEARAAADSGADGLIARGHEAGGRVGDETTFVLLQGLLARFELPVLAWGGVGLHTVAACRAAGAAGAVLDAQLAMTREARPGGELRAALSHMDGSETICLGSEIGETIRVFHRAGFGAAEELRGVARRLAADGRPRGLVLADWRREVRERAGWGSPDRHVWLLGQDAAFAARLARQFKTTGGVIGGMRQSIDEHLSQASALRPLDADSPLALSHGTRYPIVQGPMTRVSDTAAFAHEVGRGGALPFLALGLMRAPEVRALLTQVRERLGDAPWGVGILGFVPLELRQEQLEVIQEFRPPFALIAGGRPDQAQALERSGTPTYVHVPSPSLLEMFLEKGSRRFVFEGRECGGHVGPRSSFVLWNSMVDVLLESLPAADAPDCHVLFAGGVHDARSASMVAAMAAPLAARGVKVGVLLGTAYLFTRESVAAGAIVEGFQREVLRCERTVLIETGPGHATRCSDSAYTRTFESERRRLQQEGHDPEEARHALEAMNLGRLRIASKGLVRDPEHEQGPGAPKLATLDPDRQAAEGMFMIGQVAALRSTVCTIEQLHHDVAVAGSERLAAPATILARDGERRRPLDIAIVGMSCLLPKSPGLAAFWRNILGGVDAITEVPAERWDWKRYYDATPRARDRVYSRWGGFIDETPFDPMRYGIPPNTLASIEPLQLLTLDVARAALEDAGYLDRPFDRRRTSVVLGAGGGVSDLGARYIFRSLLPSFIQEPPEELMARLPEWTEDSFPGILLNVAAGRIANRFDLGGVNCTVDAACASSLAAVYLAAKELETGTSDMVIVGGADTAQNPFMYLCFSQTGAHSLSGRCRTFDEKADGIAISEGIAVLVMKRLADAERDGDRVYAVLKAIAASSDGRDKGLTAPRPEGQALALQRAYELAGFSPATVGLIEAHGTGTVAGDQAEVLTLKRVFAAAGAERQQSAIGSVKSMIGHTKCAAGVASMIKVALALHRKVLPATLHVDTPNARAGFGESPFYVSSETRPWLRGAHDHPRRAGVSAFGFGGTNFHAVLEEYTGAIPGTDAESLDDRPAELFVWRAESLAALGSRVAAVEDALAAGRVHDRRVLAHALWREARPTAGAGPAILAIVAESLDELAEKIASFRARVERRANDGAAAPGVYAGDVPPGHPARVALLFPGQGSQYPGMLADLAVRFDEVRESFERAERTLNGRLARPLGRLVFPPPAFSEEERAEQRRALTSTEVAQPALGAAGVGVLRLLESFGVRPDMAAGHSYGEYVALHAAGVLDETTLAILSETRGRSIVEAATQDLGTMAAVAAEPERAEEAVRGLGEVWIANLNAPRQTVISGSRAGIDRAIERLAAVGIAARTIPVACAFHSPLVAPAQERLARALSEVRYSPPRLPVYSNATAVPYPHDPESIGRLLAQHLISPVRFADTVRAMHAAGARVFVEAGPRNVLTGLVQQTLEGRPHLALATDLPGRLGFVHLLHVLGQLLTQGAAVDLDRLYPRGADAEPGVAELLRETAGPASRAAWLVDGSHARPAGAARPAPAPVALSAGPSPKTSEASPPVPAPAPPVPALTTTASPIAAAPFTASNGDGTARVLLEYQQMMSRFLETQQVVMQAYLQGTAPGPAARPDATPAEEWISDPGSLPMGAALAPMALADPETRPREAADATVVASAPEAASASGLGEWTTAESAEVAMRERLLAIVTERTGYSAEMLGLDLNLEADLGIDSIKRVEILGALQRVCDAQTAARLQGSMETLTRAKTLREVLTLAEARASEGPTTAPPPPVPSPARPASPGPPRASHPTETADRAIKLPRFLTVLREAPMRAEPDAALPRGVILITDDGRGVAAALADELAGAGAVPVVASHGTTPGGDPEGRRFVGDLETEGGVHQLIEAIRSRHGSLAGLLHLLPLGGRAGFEEATLADWKRRLDREVKSLYRLARAASPDLTRRGADGAWLLAATSIGGGFAFDASRGRPFFPGQGGIAGLVKTLAAEWPAVCCRVVDLDETSDVSLTARLLLDELKAPGGDSEVAWLSGRRFVPSPAAAPLPKADADAPVLGHEAVVLVTGGARGITAEVALELAERHRPTLLLVGRSPLPGAAEAAATAGIESPRELKATLMDEMRSAGQPVQPAGVEAAYRRLLAEREIRRNLEGLRRTGATVRYLQADMRDEDAVRALLDGIARDHGRLDGVIHGVGLIEDKLIEDKTPDSFDRVFDTKADSAFLLARHLDPATLGFLVFFSSVAGRFGNRGQGDYAAANEVVNKLAAHLDRQWPTRVLALNWGPWGVTGMASPEVLRQFEERGVRPVPPRSGRVAAVEEIARVGRGAVEVILGDGPWSRERSEATAAPPAATAADTRLNGSVTIPPGGRAEREDRPPLLVGLPDPGSNDRVEMLYVLDPARDLYLLDHQLGGRPVLPAAVAIELMAEVVGDHWRGFTVVGVESFRLMSGVVLKNGPLPVRVVAHVSSPLVADQEQAAVLASISDPETGRDHYRATVLLARSLPEAPPALPGPAGPLRAFPLSVAEAYDRWLFHGPLLQAIETVEGLNDTTITATLVPSSPGRCVRGAGTGGWILDPVVIDGVFQLALLFGRAHTDMTLLPTRIRRLRRFAPIAAVVGGNGHRLRCVFQARSEAGGQYVEAQTSLLDGEGRTVARLDDAEFASSRDLNRFTGRRGREAG